MRFKKKKVKNFELVKGNVLETIPKYVEKHKNLKISFLNIDIDFVESTQCVLENLYDKVVKGGVICFDNYLGKYEVLFDWRKNKRVKTIYYHGETNIIRKFLKDRKRKVIFSPLYIRPSFTIK